MENSRTEQEELQRPLDGIRIVEYGIFHAGPGGYAILGDLGADVMKIENKELGYSNSDVESLRNEGIIG